MSSLSVELGQRPTNPLIIERPDLQSGNQRAVFGVLTAVFWLLWVVLWLPLITVFGWVFFGYQFKFHMIDMEGYAGFLGVLGMYAVVILLLGGGLMAWAKYNHLRFRGVDRRKGFAAPTPADLAAIHGRLPEEVTQWQQMNIVTVHHDDEGRIARVE
ncbi:MAG: poly-beta-1,6-N-acetyl-D-glucosamine biosynthesis protein PgaD [Variovorax paradoxus]|nr:MAG: poly-beta-1,6-N-acetyl-D-glucosamine biosynthesis protein PgaD [Variovorax paradoxus]PZQ09120.1 MAG: poly-beta-1,6-N-acetyl-D-glucosamine biosynthesis protein PgaD [Variovorax paradoxus]